MRITPPRSPWRRRRRRGALAVCLLGVRSHPPRTPPHRHAEVGSELAEGSDHRTGPFASTACTGQTAVTDARLSAPDFSAGDLLIMARRSSRVRVPSFPNDHATSRLPRRRHGARHPTSARCRPSSMSGLSIWPAASSSASPVPARVSPAGRRAPRVSGVVSVALTLMPDAFYRLCPPELPRHYLLLYSLWLISAPTADPPRPSPRVPQHQTTPNLSGTLRTRSASRDTRPALVAGFGGSRSCSLLRTPSFGHRDEQASCTACSQGRDLGVTSSTLLQVRTLPASASTSQTAFQSLPPPTLSFPRTAERLRRGPRFPRLPARLPRQDRRQRDGPDSVSTQRRSPGRTDVPHQGADRDAVGAPWRPDQGEGAARWLIHPASSAGPPLSAPRRGCVGDGGQHPPVLDAAMLHGPPSLWLRRGIRSARRHPL